MSRRLKHCWVLFWRHQPSFTQSCFCEVCLSGFKMLCLCEWDKRWLKWLGLSLSDAPETADRKQLVYCSMLKGKHENILLSSNVLNKENTQKIHVFPLVLSGCIGHSKVRRLTERWCICGTLRSCPASGGSEWVWCCGLCPVTEMERDLVPG